VRAASWEVDRAPAASAAFVLSALVVLAVDIAFDLPILGMAAATALLLAGAVAYRPFLEWRFVLAALVLVILFIPIRRYAFPGSLPFELEPYRVLVALILAGWALCLLVDPRVRFRRSGLEVPLTIIVLAALGSVVVNGARVSELQADVLKALTFFGSFLLIFYLVVSVLRSPQAIDTVVKTLVLGGTALGALAIVESRTGFNPFEHISEFVPYLREDASFELGRGIRQRAFGSAEHPIALGAALVMLVPLAVYLARGSGRKLWWGSLFITAMGAFATLSRTGILMMIVAGLVFLWLRPVETRRLWPLVVPLVVFTHFALPGTLGTFRASFFPEGGLISEQRSSAGSCTSAGRIADLGPSLDEASRKPLLGYGYGTRLVSGPKQNACILDDQWLGTLLETGALGFLGWLWLYLSFLRQSGREAKADASDRGWLLTAVAASVAAYAVGMLTFDAFSFIQVTFLLFILLGIGAAVLSERRATAEEPALARAPAQGFAHP
jgi:hypothetical protein